MTKEVNGFPILEKHRYQYEDVLQSSASLWVETKQ